MDQVVSELVDIWIWVLHVNQGKAIAWWRQACCRESINWIEKESFSQREDGIGRRAFSGWERVPENIPCYVRDGESFVRRLLGTKETSFGWIFKGKKWRGRGSSSDSSFTSIITLDAIAKLDVKFVLAIYDGEVNPKKLDNWIRKMEVYCSVK